MCNRLYSDVEIISEGFKFLNGLTLYTETFQIFGEKYAHYIVIHQELF